MQDEPSGRYEPGELSDSERRAALRRAARDARERARTLVARTLVAQSAVDGHRKPTAEVLAEAQRTLAELKGAVAAYANAMRGLDEPPERAIIQAKEMANEATADAAVAMAQTSWLRAAMICDRLRDDVIRWTIDGYYGAM